MEHSSCRCLNRTDFFLVVKSLSGQNAFYDIVYIVYCYNDHALMVSCDRLLDTYTVSSLQAF